MERGFGYGKSEYEVSFGLSSRDGELSSSDPETPEPCNSPVRTRNPKRSSDSHSPQNLGSVAQTWGHEVYTPKDKRSIVLISSYDGCHMIFMSTLEIFPMHKTVTLDEYTNTMTPSEVRHHCRAARLCFKLHPEPFPLLEGVLSDQ